MNEISSLGINVKKARLQHGLTQSQVAEKIGVEVRTIMHIENGIGNPTWAVVYPLIRELEIDPRTVFFPESLHENEALQKMQILLSQCSEADIRALIPICETVLSVFHAREGILIGP